MVAGHVDKGETFTQCIIREALEEAGIILKPEDLKVAHILQRITTEAENNERVEAFITAEKWSGEISIKEPNKCDGMAWFELNNLPENIIPYVRHAINCIQNKIFYSEFGCE